MGMSPPHLGQRATRGEEASPFEDPNSLNGKKKDVPTRDSLE